MADDEMQEIRGKKEPRPPVGTNVEEDGERVSQEESVEEMKPVQAPVQEFPPKKGREARSEQELEASDFSDLPGKDVSGAKPTRDEQLPSPPKPPAQEALQEKSSEEKIAEIEESPAEETGEPSEEDESLQEVKPPDELKELRESEQEAQELLEDDSKPRYMRFHERARQSTFPGSAEQAKKDITPVSSEPQITTEQRVNQAIELHKAQQKEGLFSKLLSPIKRKLGFT